MSPPIDTAADAHVVRPAASLAPPSLARSICDAMRAVERRLGFGRLQAAAAPDTPTALDDLIAALSRGFRPDGFGMGGMVVVSGPFLEPRVWVRADGRFWSLTTVEAGVAAIRCRVEGFRAGSRLADAFNIAVRVAERRMDELNAVSPVAFEVEG